MTMAEALEDWNKARDSHVLSQDAKKASGCS
jgi:hypothetical protein